MRHRPAAFLSLFLLFCSTTHAQPLSGTQALDAQGDLAAQMVAGIDKFLLREIDRSVERRAAHWKRDFSSPANYEKSIAPGRLPRTNMTTNVPCGSSAHRTNE